MNNGYNTGSAEKWGAIMPEKTNKYEEWMISSLELVKNDNKELKCAIHGVLLIENAYTNGFFGITDDKLVIALPDAMGKSIKSKANILLKNIDSVETKRTMITHQLIITMNLNDGKVYSIRASEKVHGIPGQGEQLRIFTGILNDL